MKSIEELPELLRSRIVVEDSGCWRWTGHISSTGYGRIVISRKKLIVHRIVYETLVGAIVSGLECDHLCRNRWCCNPMHIEPVTKKENILRGMSPTAVWARTERCPKCGEQMERFGEGRSCGRCRRQRAASRYRERYATDDKYREIAKQRSRDYRKRIRENP